MSFKTEKVKNFLASDQFFIMLIGLSLGASANTLIETAVIFFINPIFNVIMLLLCVTSLIFVLIFIKE